MSSRKLNIILILAAAGFVLYSCINPFAPAKSDDEEPVAELGDQTTVEGLFTNWRYSYNYKDTAIYSNLLGEDFIFIYKNYDRLEAPEQTWTREEDIRATSRMFEGAYNLNLVWNAIVSNVGDTIVRDVMRRFSLEIELSQGETISLTGLADLRLKRKNSQDVWRISKWRDITND